LTMFQMPPEKWRDLLARAVAFHATRRMIGRLCELADREPAVAKILLELEMSAEEVAVQDGDDAAAVSRVVEAWWGALGEAMERRTLAPAARQLFADMRISLRDGVASDDPFTAMLRNIEQQAQALYGDAWRPTALSVFHIRDHPRGANPAIDPYSVTAAIVWPPAPERAEIELHVYCEKFGPAAFAAVPMLLTHECVAHVPARQAEAKADSAFAEGFLDWAAYYFLDIWAIKLDPDFGPTVRKHAQRLKTVLLGDRTTMEGIARRVGHDAAEYLQAWFEQHLLMTPDESRVRVAQLAVEINTVDRALTVKENLVSRLDWPLPPDLDDALRSWADGQMSTEKLLDVAVVGQP
jgi:hypothetical protein